MMQMFCARAHAKYGRASHAEGFTLIEAAVVLGVISLIVAAIWIVAGTVNENAKQYTFTQNLQTIVQNVRQLYQRVNKLGGNGTNYTAVLDSQDAFPHIMRLDPSTAGSGLHHPWSTVNNVVVRARGTTGQLFGVYFNRLPKKACINLLMKLSGGDVAGLNSVEVNGAAQAIPFTTTTADAACNKADSAAAININNGNNVVEWIFNLRS